MSFIEILKRTWKNALFLAAGLATSVIIKVVDGKPYNIPRVLVSLVVLYAVMTVAVYAGVNLVFWWKRRKA